MGHYRCDRYFDVRVLASLSVLDSNIYSRQKNSKKSRSTFTFDNQEGIIPKEISRAAIRKSKGTRRKKEEKA